MRWPWRKNKQGKRLSLTHLWGETDADATVLLIRVEGPILTSKASGIAGIAGRTCDGFEIENHLRLAAHDERIDAVVVQFATPGGTVPGAQAIGDDRLQKQSRGYVVPEQFTHGSSAQRMKWFKKGLLTGDITQGDTFSARDL